MARKTGSDELFRLIHSLTVEEKGYFKKFAGRHKTRGNIYIRLFDAINKQKEFEEQSLTKSFAAYNYIDLKIYLKDIITDCMVLYYKNSHPHVQLLNQIQKIYFLQAKGLSKEATKAIEKALVESNKLELFNISRYLLRMQIDQSRLTLNGVEQLAQAIESYMLHAKDAIAAEENYIANEFSNMEWFITAIRSDKTGLPPNLEQQRQIISNAPATSTRSELKKLNTISFIYDLEGNAGAQYSITKKAAALSQQFQKNNDSSFNVVPILSNHIMNSLELKKFEEMKEISNQLLAVETNIRAHADSAFINGNLCRLALYFYYGQFRKGLAEALRTEDRMVALLKANNPAGDVGFQKVKLALLFGNEKYRECWLVLQQVYTELKRTTDPGLLMFELMIQTEIGNFQSLPSMAKKAEKKLSAHGLNTPVCKALLSFFKRTSAQHIAKDAAATLEQLNKLPTGENTRPPDVFGLLRYDHWLETKCSDKTLEELTREVVSLQGEPG